MRAKHYHFFLYLLSFAAIPLASASLWSQLRDQSDTTIVFKPASPELLQKSSYQEQLNAWGFDLLISNNGFGAGMFMRREFTGEFSGMLNIAVSDVKDDAEVEQFNYFGQSFVPGKKNRLLLVPLVASVQYRLFKDDIVDNFRPYLTAGAGPTMIFVAPYATTSQVNGVTQTDQIDFFSSLKYGQAKYTVGGYVGVGAYFGLDKGSLSGICLRYYYVPFPGGVEILQGGYVKTFGGFYITLNFGTLY